MSAGKASGGDFRVAADGEAGGAIQDGSLIDRRRELRFRFDGRSYRGFAGDTLASALLANGVRVSSWSRRMQRPRGITGIGADDADGRVILRDGRRSIEARATEIQLFDGLRAKSRTSGPAARLLARMLYGQLGALTRAGAQYKTFKAPGRISWDLFEPLVRHFSNCPPVPRGNASGEHFHLHCDVLVIGGGAAGVCAARAAAAGGARVVMCEQSARFGGVSDLYPAKIEGLAAADWLGRQCAGLGKLSNVHLLARTRVVGSWGGSQVLALESCAGAGTGKHGEADDNQIRERLWRITPRRVIIATGSAERAFLFADNDRPGLMMSMAARGYLSRFGVVPGRKGIVFTNNDDAYLTAVALHKAGAEIVRIVDTRPHPEGMAAGMAMGAGVHLSFGSAISGIETDKSGRMISGVRIIPTLRAAARGSAPERVACDFVCMSGGFEPVVPELGSAFLDAVARAPGSGEAQTEQPGDAPRILAVGAANGTLALADIIAEASEAGMAAAQERPPTQSEEGKPPGGPAENSADGRLAPAGWTIRLPGGVGERDHHFVDLRADVTVADIEVAVREGYRSPALLRHYTGLDAPDGTLRAGNPKALAVLAAFTGTSPGRSPDDRPTYGPAISFGALAGIDASHAREDTAAALRQMPLAEQHRKDGAILSAIAGWEIPSSYPLSGETQAAASWREAAAARASAGMTDLSARGKFDFSGPGSARMLSLLTENDAGTLAVGDCMSSPMFDDHGRLVDLMLAARLTEGRFTLLTGAHSAALAWRRIRALMRDGGRALRVLACPVSEQWAQFAIAGPNARDVLRWLPIKGMEWDGEAFPPNSVRQGEFGGYPLRIFRTLETGELEYEIAIGARHAGNLWRSICDAGKKFELTLLGMAGRDLMLLEVGRVRGAIGSGRQDVVGLLSDDRQKILPPGAQIVLDDAVGQSAVIAHVAASALSPALGRSIALAAITDGRALIGRPVRVVTADDGQAMAEIVDPVFLAADNPAPESVTDESGPGGGEGDDE